MLTIRKYIKKWRIYKKVRAGASADEIRDMRCPECNEPVEFCISGNREYFVIECPIDPLHFYRTGYVVRFQPDWETFVDSTRWIG